MGLLLCSFLFFTSFFFFLKMFNPLFESTLKTCLTKTKVVSLFDSILIESLYNCLILLRKYQLLWKERPSTKTFQRINEIFDALNNSYFENEWIFKSFIFTCLEYRLNNKEIRGLLRNSKFFDIPNENLERDVQSFKHDWESLMKICYKISSKESHYEKFLEFDLKKTNIKFYIKNQISSLNEDETNMSKYNEDGEIFSLKTILKSIKIDGYVEISESMIGEVEEIIDLTGENIENNVDTSIIVKCEKGSYIIKEIKPDGTIIKKTYDNLDIFMRYAFSFALLGVMVYVHPDIISEISTLLIRTL